MKRTPVLALAIALTAVGGALTGAMIAAGAPAAEPAAVPEQQPIEAALTPIKKETLFFPITPCRVVDTRAAGAISGDLTAGETRSFYTSGTTGFDTQGGKAGGCGVPTNALAVAASVVATQPSTGGYLTAYPSATTRPNASTLNFGAGGTTNTGATLTVTPGGAKQLAVYNATGTTHVIIDVTGYYAPQMQAEIDAAGNIVDSTSRVVDAERANTGYYRVQFDTDVSRCTVSVTPRNFGVYASQPAINGTSAYFYLWTLNADAVGALYNSTIFVEATC